MVTKARIPIRAFFYTQRSDKRIGALCGTIMIIATIIAFGLLFVPLAQTSISGAGSAHISEFFWLPWPLGGLLCGIVALLMKAFGKGAAE